MLPPNILGLCLLDRSQVATIPLVLLVTKMMAPAVARLPYAAQLFGTQVRRDGAVE